MRSSTLGASSFLLLAASCGGSIAHVDSDLLPDGAIIDPADGVDGGLDAPGADAPATCRTCDARPDRDPERDVAQPTSACTYGGDPSPSAVTSYGACGEGINITSPPATNCGGSGAAFEYVPTMDTVASRIELFTTPGIVALLDSDAACDKPGATLFEHDLDGANDSSQIWRGAEIFPPITLVANHKYFVYQNPGSHGGMACSVSQTGVEVREYTGELGGRWDGPFSGLAWMARVVGTCP
jgi:hypothetical protein